MNPLNNFSGLCSHPAVALQTTPPTFLKSSAHDSEWKKRVHRECRQPGQEGGKENSFLIYRKVSNCYNESGNEHESFLVQMKTKAYNKYNLAYISNWTDTMKKSHQLKLPVTERNFNSSFILAGIPGLPSHLASLCSSATEGASIPDNCAEHQNYELVCRSVHLSRFPCTHLFLFYHFYLNNFPEPPLLPSLLLHAL